MNGHDLKKEAMTRVIVEYEKNILDENNSPWSNSFEEQYLKEKMPALASNNLVLAREKILYNLWHEDLQTYSKEYEIAQMQELFAIWLKEQDNVYRIKQEKNCNVIANLR